MFNNVKKVFMYIGLFFTVTVPFIFGILLSRKQDRPSVRSVTNGIRETEETVGRIGTEISEAGKGLSDIRESNERIGDLIQRIRKERIDTED